MKKVIVNISIILLGMITLIVGCTSDVYSYDKFIDDLLESDVSVEVSRESKIDLFSVQAKNVIANGERIHVFEYDNEALADEESAFIHADGRAMEKVAKTGEKVHEYWQIIGQPHFYKKGRLIVFVSMLATVLTLLYETYLRTYWVHNLRVHLRVFCFVDII